MFWIHLVFNFPADHWAKWVKIKRRQKFPCIHTVLHCKSFKLGREKNNTEPLYTTVLACNSISCYNILLIPLRVFMWDTAIRRMVSLSGLRASVLQVGTMSQSSLMYEVILFLLLLSISQWLSLWKKVKFIALILTHFFFFLLFFDLKHSNMYRSR